MTPLEIAVWTLDLLFLARILWQGEIIIKNDKERLELERARHARDTERIEERTTWRRKKQQLVLKNLETVAADSGKTTTGPTKCTTPSSPSKAESAPVVADLPKTPPSI